MLARRSSPSEGGPIPLPAVPSAEASAKAGGPKPRPRRDDVLGNLSEDDQDQVLSWVQEMSLHDAVEQIAKPRPEGLGLKTHRTSLRRFYAKRSRLDSNLNFDALSRAGQPAPFDEVTFALICRKLEEEILVGLDCMVGRSETIRLLSVYVRLRALHLRTTKPNARGRFRPQFEPFQPAFVPESAEPVQEPGTTDLNEPQAVSAEAPVEHAPNAPEPSQSKLAPGAESACSGTRPPNHAHATERHLGHVCVQSHNMQQLSRITPIPSVAGHL